MHDLMVEPLTVESVVPCLGGGGFRESGPRKMVLEENVMPAKAVVSENVIPMTTVRWPMTVVELGANGASLRRSA
jgi:hypothetical protein